MTILINNINYELRTEENSAFVVECDYKGDIVIPAVINVEGMSAHVLHQLQSVRDSEMG